MFNAKYEFINPIGLEVIYIQDHFYTAKKTLELLLKDINYLYI